MIGARAMASERASSRDRARRLPPWPQLRRLLMLAGLLVLVLAATYLLWFRDSSFVAVSEVEVTGSESDAAVAASLASAAEGMSTLHVDEGVLQEAVAGEPAVASVSAEPDFPHGLRVDVVLREPAGYVASDGGAALAADGVVLATDLERPDGLPVIEADPAGLGERAEGETLALAQVLGAAPAELSGRVVSARVDREIGPVVAMTSGLELRFGDATRAEMKWTAALAVFADRDFAGAAYLDLSAPSRPVAGG